MSKKVTIFSDIPIKQLIVNKNTCLYSLGDVSDCYIGYEHKSNNIHFKVFYKKANDYYIGYSLKFNKQVKHFATNNYIVVLNNKEKNPPSNVRVLYQDKICRFVCWTSRGARDFAFMIKNPDNVVAEELPLELL